LRNILFYKNLIKKWQVIYAIMILIGIAIIPNINANDLNVKENKELKIISTSAPEVWVDDDYYDGGYNDGHTWGYDAFDNIQDGIDNVDDIGIVHVKEGIYDVFIIESRNNIDLIGEDNPIVSGNQLAYDLSYPADVYNVIFINNSDDINIEGFHVIGTDPIPSGRDFTIFYQNSAGELINCHIDANSIENMNGLAVRAIIDSSLTITNCLIEDYGRIAVYAKTGTILNVYDSTLFGQIYNVYNWVNYGIEIEGIDESCEGIIKGNKIFNHDNTQVVAWSSAGIIVDYWRYYGPQYNCLNSTVLIENNEIYENMHGIQIVPNDNIEVIYNEIHDNTYGAISEQWFDGTNYHDYDLNAIQNWWGDQTGPYHPTENPSGIGDEIYGQILFDPWITDNTADILCSGELNWENVAPASTVEGSFVLENNGYLYSELTWEIDEKPTWGVWTISPENGTGLTPDMGQITVEVSIIAPSNKNREFTGNLKIINSDDPGEYCEISVNLKTPRNRHKFNLIQDFIEKHLILTQILQYLNLRI
jgi:hypothetical protein